MNEFEYNTFKEQIESKYQESLKPLKRERLEAIATLDKLWNMLHNPQTENTNNTSQTSIKSVSIQEINSKLYGSLTEAVKLSLYTIPKNFNKNHIKRALKKSTIDAVRNCNDSSLTGCLRRLQKQHIIEITRRGKGSTPTKYRTKKDKYNTVF